ncbi:hypothetical protein TrRE_jg1707 [Triparma retinervis]|uniref:Secreted protein n=1 Tax=Triparma retinervis TaxID=2557542 RepID=A0A9W7A0W4_9STRA|nr:hypothetical protein TrRE_jg1707 [Triparma retinervis]
MANMLLFLTYLALYLPSVAGFWGSVGSVPLKFLENRFVLRSVAAPSVTALNSLHGKASSFLPIDQISLEAPSPLCVPILGVAPVAYSLVQSCEPTTLTPFGKLR